MLPMLLKGYGKTFARYPDEYTAAVILVCDLDCKDKVGFLDELDCILNDCNPKPKTYFCLAIEEGEAWFLGDLDAVRSAYPRAKDMILRYYINDSICGTWEKLADAIYPGGSAALLQKGWQAVGSEKYRWAKSISPHMNVDVNKSPSFIHFRDIIRAFKT